MKGRSGSRMIEHAYQHIVGMHLSADKNAMSTTFLSRIKGQAEVQIGFWIYCSSAANVGGKVVTKKFVNIFGALNRLWGTGRPLRSKTSAVHFPLHRGG